MSELAEKAKVHYLVSSCLQMSAWADGVNDSWRDNDSSTTANASRIRKALDTMSQGYRRARVSCRQPEVGTLSATTEISAHKFCPEVGEPSS